MAGTVAEQVVDMLALAGIKRIYAVTGDSLNELNDAIRRDGRIRWIHVRHEEVGAYAASAEAQLSGLACCAGSSGPGHVHLINGLYDAHRSSAPVIAIASTVMTTEFGTDYFQETNTIKLFDDCSHYNQLAATPAQLPRMLQAGIQYALNKKGVAVIGLPGDVTKLPAEDPGSSYGFFRPEPKVIPSDAELRQLAGMIAENKKITLFCGIGASDASLEVARLSSLLKAPVGYSFKAKMAIQGDNPNEVGMTGLLGLPSAYHAMHECDLLILLGTDFPYVPFIPSGKKIVQIDVRAEHLGRRAKLDMGLAGNIRETLEALMPMLQAQEDDKFLKEQLAFYKQVKEQQQTYVGRRERRNDPSGARSGHD